MDRQKVAVVTGASSGVGKAAAKMLAAQGWHVIALGRDPQRSADAEAEIRAAGSPDAKVDMVTGDLALLADTARMAQEIARLTDRVDALLNNAGGVRAERHVTAEGNEATFAGNHLGHFLLTGRLMPQLRNAPDGARILSTTSDAHGMGPGFDWDDLQLLDKFNPGWAYCNAKLANVLFTRGLAQRLKDQGIVANAVHPGVVASNFTAHADEGMRARMANLDAFTPEQAAETLVWLATSDEGGKVTGALFHQHKPFPIHPLGQDDASVDRLWAESERLVAGVELWGHYT